MKNSNNLKNKVSKFPSNKNKEILAALNGIWDRKKEGEIIFEFKR